MGKRTALRGSVGGQGQQSIAGLKIKKKQVIDDQAQSDAAAKDAAHTSELAASKAAAPALGDTQAFAAMLADAASSGTGSTDQGGGGTAAKTSGGGVSTGLLVAGGLAILGGAAAAAGGGKSAPATPPAPVNQPPAFAGADTAVSVDEDKVLNGSVKATDANGDAITYAVGTRPTNGTVTVNADGTYVYTPNANYNGADSFTVTASDGKGGTATQTVKVTVNAVNDAPAFSAAEITPPALNEDSNLAGSVKATDVENDSITYAIGSRPTNGAVTVNADGSYVYTPNANYNGADSFTITASDGKGGQATQTVKLTVTAVNDAPVITSTAQTGVTGEDGVVSTTGRVTVSDVDAGATATFSGVRAGTYGTFTIDASTGVWKYDLNNSAAVVQALDAGETKTETFTVTVTDDKGATATQNVVITINGKEDIAALTSDEKSLVESDVALSTSGRLVLTDQDATDATVVVQTNKAGTYGKFSIDATGAWTYVTNDAVNQLDAGQVVTDTFDVATTDGGSAKVTVTITGSQDIAALTSDEKSLVESDVALSTSGRLVLTDQDATDATVVVQTNKAGTYGKFSIDATGAWTYVTNDAVNQLDAGQVVTDTFDVATTDGGSAKVTVTITGTNDLPEVN